MITVSVSINGEPIFARTARNVEGPDKEGLHTYKVDDGSSIKHHRSNGAISLAIKMLETIKEP